MTAEEIIKEIEEHMAYSKGRWWSSHYIGITDNPEHALFEYHKIHKDNHWYIYVDADTPKEAEKARDYFLKKGMRGNTYEVCGKKNYVYCYEVTQKTLEYEPFGYKPFGKEQPKQKVVGERS